MAGVWAKTGHFQSIYVYNFICIFYFVDKTKRKHTPLYLIVNKNQKKPNKEKKRQLLLNFFYIDFWALFIFLPFSLPSLIIFIIPTHMGYNYIAHQLKLMIPRNAFSAKAPNSFLPLPLSLSQRSRINISIHYITKFLKS